ncbi:hypothetical protein ACFX1X_031955 [Malus domestica]
MSVEECEVPRRHSIETDRRVAREQCWSNEGQNNETRSWSNKLYSSRDGPDADTYSSRATKPYKPVTWDCLMVNILVHDDARVDGENQDGQYILDG